MKILTYVVAIGYDLTNQLTIYMFCYFEAFINLYIESSLTWTFHDSQLNIILI